MVRLCADIHGIYVPDQNTMVRLCADIHGIYVPDQIRTPWLGSVQTYMAYMCHISTSRDS